jgi:hypothetical protein
MSVMKLSYFPSLWDGHWWHVVQEERELLLRGGPAAHPTAVLDETAIVEVPLAEEEGASSEARGAAEAGDTLPAGQQTRTATEQAMMRAHETWLSVRTAAAF